MSDIWKRLVAEKNENIKKSIFVNCSSQSCGGAIFLDSAQLRIKISFCNFASCYSNNRGGAVAVLNAAEAILKLSCLTMNSAKCGTGFVFWSDQYNMLDNSVNYTSEVAGDSSHASSFGGEIKAVHSFDNMSHYRSVGIKAIRGWLFLGKSSNALFEYGEIFNCSSDYLISLDGNFEMIIDKLNIISCKSSYLFHFSGSSSLEFKSSVIINANIPSFAQSNAKITTSNVFSSSAIGSIDTKAQLSRYQIQSIKCGILAGQRTCICRKSSRSYCLVFVILIMF